MINIDNAMDLRSELMIWQGMPYNDLLRSSIGTSFESNVRTLGYQMGELNKAVGAGTVSVETGIQRFNNLIDIYNSLTDAVTNYSGWEYYEKAVYAGVVEAPGKILDFTLDTYEAAKEKVESYGASNLMLYGGLILAGGILLYALAGGAGRGLVKRITG